MSAGRNSLWEAEQRVRERERNAQRFVTSPAGQQIQSGQTRPPQQSRSSVNHSLPNREMNRPPPSRAANHQTSTNRPSHAPPERPANQEGIAGGLSSLLKNLPFDGEQILILLLLWLLLKNDCDKSLALALLYIMF
jgi:hypothetical protein